MFHVLCNKCNQKYTISVCTVNSNFGPKYIACKNCRTRKRFVYIHEGLKDFGYEVLTPLEEFIETEFITFKQRKLMSKQVAGQLVYERYKRLKRDVSS